MEFNGIHERISRCNNIAWSYASATNCYLGAKTVLDRCPEPFEILVHFILSIPKYVFAHPIPLF